MKYVKNAKEMIAFSRNELQIQIEDTYKHNQVLGDKIENYYHGMYNSLRSAFKVFMAENVDSSSINLGQESKKPKKMGCELQLCWTDSIKTRLVFCYHEN